MVTDPSPHGGLALVGRTRRGDDGAGTSPLESERCAGDICVFFEPTGTVVRLFGRVDQSMRKELLEAAFDVVGRGGSVTIDVAPDATVDPGALCFLRKITRQPGPTQATLSAADRLRSPHDPCPQSLPPQRPRAPQDAGRRVPAAR